MMRAKQPRTRQQEWHQGYPFRIPSASATDRSPLLAPPKSWAWHAQRNVTRIGPPTFGGLRLLAKRPRRRRRERLQGFSGPYEIWATSQTRSPGRGALSVVKCVPAKPDHRLDIKNRPLKTPLQPVINKDHILKTWPV
jgi:hypothetical protein